MLVNDDKRIIFTLALNGNDYHIDMCGTSHFWSRSRREKNFGPGPGEKKILVPVPSETNFG